MTIRRVLGPWLLILGLTSVNAGQVKGVTPDELQALMEQGATVVDVRTPEEWKVTGLIPGEQRLTYFDSAGQYDHEKWLRDLSGLVKDKAMPVVLVCRSGHRSALVGKMLSESAGYSRVYHLEKGVRGWIAEGRTLVAP